MTEVGRALWQGCHTLRHEGVAYDEYVDQLSTLLFLKTADEMNVSLPEGATWRDLVGTPDDGVLDRYTEMLKTLGEEPGLIGDALLGARSKFRTGEGFRAILRLLDDVRWSQLDRDAQGAAFEYLVEKTAADGKQGAGQYFTPRALVDTVVECMRPGLAGTDRLIGDPAMGTGGFLVSANRFITHNVKPSSASVTFRGNEVVERVRRMGLMNMHVNGLSEPSVLLGDALLSPPVEPFDLILTNPPFGTRGGARPPRDEFWVSTGNKQVNFVQHCLLGLRPGGRAALVLPDSCFDGGQIALDLWSRAISMSDVHTILRLPKGTFAPYTAGTMTNVVFVRRGSPTTTTWLYDARTNSRRPTGRAPLRFAELAEFRHCYGFDPNGQAARSESDAESGRWSQIGVGELRDCGFRLDALSLSGSVSHHSPSGTGGLDSALEFVERDLNAALDLVRQLRAGPS